MAFLHPQWLVKVTGRLCTQRATSCFTQDYAFTEIKDSSTVAWDIQVTKERDAAKVVWEKKLYQFQ